MPAGRAPVPFAAGRRKDGARMITNIDLDAIEERHLAQLVERAVPEGRRIEFKRELPERSGAAEFLADVCSFANADGGDLVYGMEEEGGAAAALVGVQTADPDAELRRLQRTILSGVDPRVPGLRGRYVTLGRGPSARHAFVIRVPRSPSGPHAVYRNEAPRFVVRDSSGKHAMDVAEIRSAVLAAEEGARGVRSFREERLADVAAGRTSVDFRGVAAIVVHALPVAAFAVPPPEVDLRASSRSPGGFLPIGTGGNERYTADGRLVHWAPPNYGGRAARLPESYALLFHSGAVEAVDSAILWPEADGPIIPSLLFEKDILRAVHGYLATQAHLGIEGPVHVGLSLLGIAGYRMATRRFRAAAGRPVERDRLVVPDVVAEDTGLDEGGVERLLRPAFDRVWHACGYPRSPHYDAAGAWAEEPW